MQAIVPMVKETDHFKITVMNRIYVVTISEGNEGVKIHQENDGFSKIEMIGHLSYIIKNIMDDIKQRQISETNQEKTENDNP